MAKLRIRAGVRIGTILVVLCVGLGIVLAGPLPSSLSLADSKWSNIDYGPAMKLSVQVSENNIAYKGLAVRLDTGPGGVSRGKEFMVFDTDTLRWAGGWTGEGFIDWRGIALNGQHEIHPSIIGPLWFANPVQPGWGRPSDGSFADDRVLGRDGLRYGTLAPEWGHWNGHYVYDEKVVLSYSVGGVEILESAGAMGPSSDRVMTRTLNLGPRTVPLVLQVAREEDADVSVADFEGLDVARFEILGQSSATLPETVATVRDGGAGSKFIATAGDNGEMDLRLTIPAGEEPVSLTIYLGRISKETGSDAFARVVRESQGPSDLTTLTKGGPAHWPEKIVTQGELGNEDGPYAIDTITHPVDNPYRSWMRFGGFDFFEDDSRAAICTWNGDVWIVDGIGESLKELTWQRIATGMFQPLGVAIVDGDIYVGCRDQITVLRDLNGDGETDYYENFNNDHQVTEHFHEFALDLKFAADGNFYYTKGGRHGADSITPQHGTLIRVSRDGSKSEIVANGFRSPNGLGLGPAGEVLISDNQGHWTPANRINWVEPGGFYGYMWGYHEGQVIEGYDEPLCWVHNEVDRSPGTLAWVPDYRWGPLGGRIITASYGMGQILHVMHEEIDGVRQGGVVKFPLEFHTGVTRAKFRKRDGQLYLAGLFGWSSNKTQPGAFYRVRYTGKKVYMPEELRIASDGLSLTFTDPLDPDSATDPGNYGLSRWNYKWTQRYGSPDFKLDGTEGRDQLQASWAALSEDRRTVYLEIPDIEQAMQMQILVNIKAGDGARLRHKIQHTVHTLGGRSVRELSGHMETSGLRRSETPPESTTRGLAQTIVSEMTGARDTRVSRLAAIYVAEGEPPSPFLAPGPFRSTSNGFLKADFNEVFRFSVEGNGQAELSVNGSRVSFGEEVELRQGLNPVSLKYQSPSRGSAEFRLYWESSDLFREPVPAEALARLDSSPDLKKSLRARNARSLVTQHRCLRCHAPDPDALEQGMPELRADAPILDRVGEKYNAPWVIEKILNPGSLHTKSFMPSVLRGPDKSENRREAGHIAAHLMTLSNPVNPISLSAELRETGETLYNNLGCFTCHRLDDDDRGEYRSRISLARIGEKWRVGSLTEYILDPHRDYAHNPMPNFRLSNNEADALVSYLIGSAADLTSKIDSGSGDARLGKGLLTNRGCLNCHSLEGHSTGLRVATWDELLESEMDNGCLAIAGEERGRAPEFNLTVQERIEIRAFIAEESDSLFRFVPSEYAARQVEALDCLACHGRDGSGDTWSLLAPDEPVEDETLETIHLYRPRLDFVGEKLRTEWTTALLAGMLDYKPRPGLTARMPAFPAYAGNIAKGLAAQHGFPPIDESRPQFDADLAVIGRELALSDDMFRCNSCHGVGANEPLAGADTETINFAHIPARLRRSYFDRFVLDPQRIMPGTQMPQFSDDDGRSSIPHVLDGEMSEQLNAIWHFMRSLNPVDRPE